MRPTVKSIILWGVAVILGYVVMYYQRQTGPTYPVAGEKRVGTTLISYSLIRTYQCGSPAAVRIVVPDTSISGECSFRRFKSYDKWSVEPMQRSGDTLIAMLPALESAGKVMYQVTLKQGSNSYLLTGNPVILRYKGEVPPFVLISHILFICLAILLSTRTGLEAIFNGKRLYLYTWLTVIFLGLSVLVLGPILQKYAFGEFWTGWPVGHDLTDNKSVIAFLCWLITLVILSRNREKKIWPVIAMVITIVVFLIPHSLKGSEIDYTKEAPASEISR